MKNHNSLGWDTKSDHCCPQSRNLLPLRQAVRPRAKGLDSEKIGDICKNFSITSREHEAALKEQV